MSTHDPALQALVDRIAQARADGVTLNIRGGGTKDFYGEEAVGQELSTRELSGISSYEPTELVITARAGTPLREVEAALAERGQCLAFEPPRFGEGGTIGGMVAAGLSGPARASAGCLRDHLLGATLLDGRGQLLRFGGQVMKNVAGYDIARALAGSLGVLGVVCEASLKVLPQAPAQATLRFELEQPEALKVVNTWAGQPLPLNASAWWEGMLVVRLAGAAAAVEAAARRLGGEAIEPQMAASFWRGVRDHDDEFFVGARRAVEAGAALWRLSMPCTAPALKVSGQQLVEWGGAQRWICTSAPAAALRQMAAEMGGHATLFRARDKSAGVFAPLTPPLLRIHRELKRGFDPDGLFNRGRLYRDL